MADGPKKKVLHCEKRGCKATVTVDETVNGAYEHPDGQHDEHYVQLVARRRPNVPGAWDAS